MKKSSIFGLLLTSLGVLTFYTINAQQISTGELNTISQNVKKSYFVEPKEIDDIIKQYIVKGFQLRDVVYTHEEAANIHVSVHTLDNILSQGKTETIIITTIDTNSIKKEAIIEFTTTDFTLYQKWFNSANVSYVEKKIEPMVYIYSNANKAIFLGAKTTIEPNNENGVAKLHIKVDPVPIVYFLKVRYKLL